MPRVFVMETGCSLLDRKWGCRTSWVQSARIM